MSRFVKSTTDAASLQGWEPVVQALREALRESSQNKLPPPSDRERLLIRQSSSMNDPQKSPLASDVRSDAK